MIDDNPRRRAIDTDIALLKQEMAAARETNDKAHVALDKKIDWVTVIVAEMRADLNSMRRLMMGWQAAGVVALVTACGGLLWVIWEFSQNRILVLPTQF